MNDDVGIGVVYEQFMLAELLLKTAKKYRVKTALEAPLYGMAGITGINSVPLARNGVSLSLAEYRKEKLEEAKKAWKLVKSKPEFFLLRKKKLPFEDNSFDMVWNFAALWHLRNPEAFLEEAARVAKKLVIVFMPNRTNPCFLARKLTGKLPEKHRWTDMNLISEKLEKNGLKIKESGVIDIPPWPDTVVSLGELLSPLGMKKPSGWRWSMIDYYTGKAPGMKKKIEGYAFLERCSFQPLRKFWAHHRYVIGKKLYPLPAKK